MTTDVSETSIRQVRVGQQVRVTPLGSGQSVAGRVTAIGLTADTSSGTATYPVTVSVPRPRSPLPIGAAVALDIISGTSRGVVTLPVSAMSVDAAGAASVEVVGADGTPGRQPVTLGRTGERTVEVVDGLDAGQQVVLADLDQAITGAGTSTGGGFRVPGGGVRTGPGGGGPPTVTFGQ